MCYAQFLEDTRFAGCIARLLCCVKVGHSALKLEDQSPLRGGAATKGMKKPSPQTENIKGQSSQHMLSPSHGPNGSQMMVHTSDRSNLKTEVLGKLSLNASAYTVLGFHLFVSTGFHLPSKLH